MYPEIFEIGPLSVAPYGLFVAFGIMLSVVLSRRANEREAFLDSYIYDRTMLMGIIWSLLGARLLYVWTARDSFSGNWGAAFQFSDGGLVFFGGPIAAALYLAWHFVLSAKARQDFDLPERWRRFARFTDIAVPAMVIGHAFGRIGCFMAGCCYGRPFASENLLSVHYPMGSDAYFSDVLHNGSVLHGNVPIPLVESLCLLALFFWLRRRRVRRQFLGEVTLAYMILYPAIRFLLEIFRGDSLRGYVWELEALSSAMSELLGLRVLEGQPLFLSTSQFISLIVAVGAFWLSRRLRKERSPLTPPAQL